ncbi:MAG TPA: invasion associated locus B family protein [Devosia sp.]|nr:invasion associated locus B family protein [Devosia sp.]
MTSARRRIASGLTACALLAGMALGANAQSTQGATNLGTFKAWTAWQGKDDTGMVCFIAADPTSSEPKEVGGKPINRDPAVFLIVHRKGVGLKNEAQTLIGYPFKADSHPSVSIDGKSYTMVVENSAAWLAQEEDENAFVAAMKAGTTLIVKGTSARGTVTTDTYSLAGATAAMEMIDKACA